VADFLTEMARASRERAKTARAAGYSTVDLASLPLHPPDIDATGFGLIAEAKLAGPASGRLVRSGEDDVAVVDLARSYADGGASMVSVLTEPLRFDGSLDHLRSVANSIQLPVMRKDFLVDPIQILEARAHGASGVLLIARILSSDQLVEMVETADRLGMFSLVEVFDEEDLDLASATFSLGVMVGVNSRDLTDLSVDRGRLGRLRPLIPDHLVSVAESGLETSSAIQLVVELGYRMALVGAALSSADDPVAATNRMVMAGRSAARAVAT